VILGYNTNGFAHHRLEDAAEILAEIGYASLAVTLERDFFDPPDHRGVAQAVARLNEVRRRTGMRLTIETGARFILDPRRKHQPTLLSEDRAERALRSDFLRAAVDIAAGVEAESVSLWSGALEETAEHASRFDLLAGEVSALANYANERGVRLSFEPEPGMLIETMEQFSRLHDALGRANFGLTLDVGHVHCLSDGDAADQIRQWSGCLWNVHVEDMRRGVHEHLMFGEGEMRFTPIFDALREIEYQGPVHVELSRHSHDAVSAARRAVEFLAPYVR